MTAYTGALDQCRHCGHHRRRHRQYLTGYATRACTSSGACACHGFAPSHLAYTALGTTRDGLVLGDGREWDGLPSMTAALELAWKLTDIDDMLGRVTA